MFAFLYVKGNSKEICEEISCFLFQKNADDSMLLRFKAKYFKSMLA